MSVGRIGLTFTWEGENLWNEGTSCSGLGVREVELKFKDSKSKISVDLPENIHPLSPREFSFKHCKEGTVTSPNVLSVTIAQISNLTVNAIFSGKTAEGKIQKNKVVVKLEIPKQLDGVAYKLAITSKNLFLSARLVKTERVESSLPTIEVLQARLKAVREEASALASEFFETSSTAREIELHKRLQENDKLRKDLIETLRRRGVTPETVCIPIMIRTIGRQTR